MEFIDWKGDDVGKSLTCWPLLKDSPMILSSVRFGDAYETKGDIKFAKLSSTKPAIFPAKFGSVGSNQTKKSSSN